MPAKMKLEKKAIYNALFYSMGTTCSEKAGGASVILDPRGKCENFILHQPSVVHYNIYFTACNKVVLCIFLSFDLWIDKQYSMLICCANCTHTHTAEEL